jgi:predicted nucleic acid-binding protein
MPSAVLDSVVLVSALLTPGGVASDVVRQAREGAFTCCLSEEILAETRRVLNDTPRLRQRYTYSDEDLLSLRTHDGITMTTPEACITLLRGQR